MTGNKGLQLPDDRDCAFCDYLGGRRPYTILDRNKAVAMLVTREQRGFGHILVLPISHVSTILDVDSSIAKALMIGVRDAARLIDGAFRRPGIAIWQNNGTAADQTVSHLHFHVAGTLDGGGTERGTVPELDLAATEAIANLLRARGKMRGRGDG